MTALTSIDGQDLIQPNAVHYTKPIVMLIDEMSGSGGDAFPSLMKGYGRAKLVGTRTMGLGGHVVAQPALFYSQITPEMTKSLFYRPDGVAVENNGAVPDYPYTITRNDFMYKYVDYRNFYTDKIMQLVKTAQPNSTGK
jgi:C-terminal processing protease CtpA/Prc